MSEKIKETKVTRNPIAPLNDAIPGFLSRGSTLELQNGGEWTEVAAVQSMPAVGGAPETVDVTHLGSERMSSIAGLEAAETLEFAIVYQGANFAQLTEVAGTGLQINFRITYPDGLQATFTGSCTLAVDAVEVNAAIGFTLSVVVSDGPDFVLP